MRNLKKIVFFSVILVIVCFTILTIFGFNTRWGATITHHFKGVDTINFANDLGDEAKITLSYKEMDEDQKHDTEMILKKRLNLIGIEENNIFFDKENKLILITFPKSCAKPRLDYGDISVYLSGPGELKIFKTNKSQFDFLFQNNKNSESDELLMDNSAVKSVQFRYLPSRQLKNLEKIHEKPAIKLSLFEDSYSILEDLYKVAAQQRNELLKQQKENKKLDTKIKKKEEEIKKIKDGKNEEDISEEDKETLKNYEADLEEDRKELAAGKENYNKINEQLGKNRIDAQLDGVSIFMGNVLEMFDENMNIMLTNGSLSGNDLLIAANKIIAEKLPVELSIINLEANTPKLGVAFIKNITIFTIILAILFILFIAIRFRILAGLLTINIISQFCFILVGFTGLLSFVPGFCLTLPATIGAIFSIIIGVSCFYNIANKIVYRLNVNKNLELSVKQTYKIDVKPLVKLNIFVMFILAIVLGIFSPTPELFSTLLIPLNTLLEANSQNSIFSFAYAMFFGIVGTLIFQLLTTKLILQSATDFKIFRNVKLYGGRINETKN